MNRDDVIRMAREAGPRAETASGDAIIMTYESLERFRAMAAAAEQESIAAWIETQRNDVPACGFEFAAAIRSRGTK